MNPFIKIVIPALQVPADGMSAAALRAEVVKEQAEGRLLPQQYQRDKQPAANGSATDTNSNPGRKD